MAIQRDLSAVPGPESPGTWEPDTENLRTPAAVASWWAEREESGALERPAADETLPFRGSWAGLRCDRQLWYALHGHEQSNPMTGADHWRLATGAMGHELLQEHFDRSCRDGEAFMAEYTTTLEMIGIPGSSHADGVWFDVDKDGDKEIYTPVEVLELKTIGGFQFKIMTLPFKGGPRGPRIGDVIQGALVAAVLDVPLRLVYVSLELVGADITSDRGLSEDRRFVAEWTLSAEQCRDVAAAEAQRIRELLPEVAVPLPRLRDPEVTEGAVVTDNRKGTWVSETANGPVYGRTWRCGYCGQRDRCTADGL